MAGNDPFFVGGLDTYQDRAVGLGNHRCIHEIGWLVQSNSEEGQATTNAFTHECAVFSDACGEDEEIQAS